MNPAAFADHLRDAMTAPSRRAALGALLAAVLGAFLPGAAASRRDPGQRKRRAEDRNRKRDGRDKRDRDRKKRKNNDRQKSSKGCKDNYSESEILDFIAKAARKYNQSKNDMVRVARCESNLDPCAFNKSGPYYGLYQFLKSTWKTTPYKDKSIWDPEAQALAAAWMWKQGRKKEWACK